MTDSARHGFTLLEMLVAMTVFSIIVLTLFSTFRTFLSSSDLVNREIRRQERFQQGLQVITADLEQIFLPRLPRYHPPDFNETLDRFRFTATETRVDGQVFPQLQFASLNQLDLGPGYIHGVGRISYYIHGNGNRYDLHRSDRTFLTDHEPDPCTDPILIRDIRSFSLTFTDRQGNQHATWDSESRFFEYTVPAWITIDIMTAAEGDRAPVTTAVSIPVIRQVEE